MNDPHRDTGATTFTVIHDGACDDTALLGRIGQGDESAMAAFYREHGRVVLAHPGPEVMALDRAELAEVRDAIRELAAPQREVLGLSSAPGSASPRPPACWRSRSGP